MKKPNIEDFIPSKRKIYCSIFFLRLLGIGGSCMAFFMVKQGIYSLLFASKYELHHSFVTTLSSRRFGAGHLFDISMLNNDAYITFLYLFECLITILSIVIFVFSIYLIFASKETLYNYSKQDLNEVAQYKYERALKKYERKNNNKI